MLKKSACIVLLLFVFPLSVQAHKVNFFAYVENSEVMCEGGFPGGKPCRECPIIVKDAATEQEIMRLKSNNAGMAQFPIDDTIKKAEFGLKIVLSGGEGHQSEWLLEPEEYLGVSAPVTAQFNQTASLETEQKAEVARKVEIATAEADLEQVIANVLESKMGPMLNQALETKIGPLRRQLAMNQESGPSFVVIFGGIGWIMGIAGIIAWFRSRQGN